MRNIKCADCEEYRNEWCEKVVDSPDPDILRDCQYWHEHKDMVEVIRCKDCKHMQKDKVFHQCWCNGNEVKPDHFCGYAERRKAMDDLISRQAAIDAAAVPPEWDGMYIQDLNGRIREAIEHLPSAQPELRWIPVTERLPKKEGWYITTIESEKTGKRRIENDLFAVDIALAHGHTPNKFCKDGYRQRTVAWMPLPEPYKEESDG